MKRAAEGETFVRTSLFVWWLLRGPALLLQKSHTAACATTLPPATQIQQTYCIRLRLACRHSKPYVLKTFVPVLFSNFRHCVLFDCMQSFVTDLRGKSSTMTMSLMCSLPSNRESDFSAKQLKGWWTPHLMSIIISYRGIR